MSADCAFRAVTKGSGLPSQFSAVQSENLDSKVCVMLVTVKLFLRQPLVGELFRISLTRPGQAAHSLPRQNGDAHVSEQSGYKARFVKGCT